jgi:hypothetical protein
VPEAFRAKSPRVAFGNVLAEPLKASWSVRGVVLRRLTLVTADVAIVVIS